MRGKIEIGTVIWQELIWFFVYLVSFISGWCALGALLYIAEFIADNVRIV